MPPSNLILGTKWAEEVFLDALCVLFRVSVCMCGKRARRQSFAWMKSK